MLLGHLDDVIASKCSWNVTVAGKPPASLKPTKTPRFRFCVNGRKWNVPKKCWPGLREKIVAAMAGEDAEFILFKVLSCTAVVSDVQKLRGELCEQMIRLRECGCQQNDEYRDISLALWEARTVEELEPVAERVQAFGDGVTAKYIEERLTKGL
jgi:hypothetical protein